ncbi:MAG: hypothetical protein B7Z55_00475 [Planctomycetales bacterium 12-60-4]|nr:MAG: hypothetical protein B7Z55_00475 [Planctomycetales bacterium 12-60-4]
MSVDSPPRRMTVDEFLSLRDRRDVERMLIRGELWERKMTYRNPWHSTVLAQITFFLQQWNRTQQAFQGFVVAGDAGFRIKGRADSVVGIDAAIVLKQTPLYRYGGKVVFDGPPILAVEILSPSDRQKDIETKVDIYLGANVPLVWIIAPHQRTVTVYRPDAEPELFAQSATLTGEPHLPGLSIPVSELFAADL